MSPNYSVEFKKLLKAHKQLIPLFLYHQIFFEMSQIQAFSANP